MVLLDKHKYTGYHGFPCKQSSAALINTILLDIIWKECHQNFPEESQFPFIHNVSPVKLVNALPHFARLASWHFSDPEASETKKKHACKIRAERKLICFLLLISKIMYF